MQQLGLKCSAAKRGFTLIELLIVIAIIALLAAILFPVFARARENARRASCQSNLRQILLGVMQYTQDHDEKYPMGHNNTAGVMQPERERSWYNALQPYLKSTQILLCPSDSNQIPAEHTPAFIAGGYRVSYIVNRWFGDGLAGGSGGLSLAAIINPATTVYIADGSKKTDGVTATPSSPDKLGGLRMMSDADVAANGVDTNWGGPNPRHLETAVFGFADGHVKSGRISDYYGARSTPKGDCLNPAVGCR